MSNENRRRAAHSGWARRRSVAPLQATQTAPGAGVRLAEQSVQSRAPRRAGEPQDDQSDAEPLFRAYRAAKAKHDAAIAALKLNPPDPELIRRQAEAAVEEIDALDALQQASTREAAA